VRCMSVSFKGLTAVVVEDDWMLREITVTELQEMGWTVLEAASGAGALMVLRKARTVDLLVTDIQLADAITGWDVAEAFRVSDPEVPVIYASGNSSNQSRRVTESVFLTKPIEISELKLACRKLLGLEPRR
jgi:two-component system, chemotaxis family, CheB/CheR fusion protein